MSSAASYTKYGLAFSLSSAPDTAVIYFLSSDFTNPHAGSDLKVDNIHFASEPLGIDNISSTSGGVSIEPNPFRDVTTINFSKDGEHYVEIDDIQGRKVFSFVCNGNQYHLNNPGTCKGSIYVEISTLSNRSALSRSW